MIGCSVAVDDGGAAEGGHGDGHGCFGDGVHRGGDARDGEWDVTGQSSRELDSVGGKVDVMREKNHIVVGVGKTLREESGGRKAVIELNCHSHCVHGANGGFGVFERGTKWRRG